jgi:hypothetical protein
MLYDALILTKVDFARFYYVAADASQYRIVVVLCQLIPNYEGESVTASTTDRRLIASVSRTITSDEWNYSATKR